MMSDAIHIIYGSDDNYWFPTAVSASSAAYGCSRAIIVHLFDAGVSDEHYLEYERLVKKANADVVCERHRLDAKMFDGYGEWRGSVVTYSRMFIQELLPNLNWAIYVDGDTLWLGDIAKLWDLRDETKLIQASKDPPMPMNAKHPDEDWYAENGLAVPRDSYLCMGLMLANLKAMREFRLGEKVRNFMKKYPRPKIVDQTVLNYICRDNIAALPSEWGVFSAWHMTADLTKDACVHYVDDIPWKRHKVNRLISDIVLVWYEFTMRVDGLDLRRRYLSRFSWMWRRWVFVVCKHFQFAVKLIPFVHSRLRNTCGLSKSELWAIRGRYLK